MNIFKKIWYWNKNTWWYPLKNLKKYNFTKLHLDSVFESFNFKPYDYTHIWRVERAHLIETKSYFQISKIFDHTDDIKYIDICINLLDILIDDGDGLMDYKNMKFKKYVNTKNFKRFKPNAPAPASCDNLEICNYDVYMVKVKHLYYEILKNKIQNWWD